MAINLIINADDYGRSKFVSAGIRSAHLNGIVTSTTAMMNLPGTEFDLDIALKDCPKLGLGVHLNLTAGKPISPEETVPTLVDDNGWFPSSQGFINKLSTISLEQIRLEWDAQIQKFIQVTGRRPDHLDSHHHSSYLSYGLFNLMLEIAREYNCAIRYPLSGEEESPPIEFPPEIRFSMKDFIPLLMKEYSPVKTDVFYSSFFDQNATVGHLLTILEGLVEGTSEIMCHPGYPDSELAQTSSYAKQRERERMVLQDGAIRAYIMDQEINMIRFGDLNLI